MCSTFKQRPIRPPLAGIVAIALLFLAAPLAAQDSNDATLSALSLSDPATDLNPAFDPDETSYRASVAHDVAFITVAATLSNQNGALFLILPSDSKENENGHEVALRVGANTITVRVTAAAGNTKTYTITVTRAESESTDATLQSLSLSDGATLKQKADPTKGFDPDVTTYTASVANTVDAITVTATPTVTHDQATAKIGEDDATGGGHEVSLRVGANTIRVTVTAVAGNTKAYTITVTRAESESTDATLRSLSLSGATLKQGTDPTKGFDPDVTTYTASVAHAVASITVTATPNVSQATVDYPTDDAPGTGGHQVSLNVGANTITVTVTPSDGTSATKAYTITVTRAASPSTDATLRSLSLSGATLKQGTDPTKGFDPDVTTYTASVAHAVASITVTATPNVSQATVDYPTDDAPGTGGHQVSLNVGANTITVTVTPSDGTSATKAYTITVTRAASPSTDATLRSLSLSGATLKQGTDPTKGFDPDVTTYTASVAHAVASIMVTATPNVSQATVAITWSNSAEGSGSGRQVSLVAGEATTVTVTVTATGGGNPETYTITVTRAASESTDATLQLLSLSAGTLSPTFYSATTTYTASVAHDVAFITVTATPNVSGATPVITPFDSNLGTNVHEVSLNVGENTITVTVTATDESTTETYIIRVNRGGLPSTDATLSELTLSTGTLSPAFDPGTTEYTASVAHTVLTLTVTAEAPATGATIAYTPSDADGQTDNLQVVLRDGENTIRVTVTARDRRTRETYTIRVNRAMPPATDATLSGLTLTGAVGGEMPLSPIFYSATTSYTATVRHDESSITVAATPSQGTFVITPDDADDNTNDHEVDLEVGTATIQVTVTAQDGTTKKTYTIRVTRVRLVQDATLRSLTLSTGTLSPSFSSNRTAYTASVANSVSSITIQATPTVSGSTAQIGGADATSGRRVSLNVGSNKIRVVVTARAGQTKTYTITVTRAGQTTSRGGGGGGGGGGTVTQPDPKPPSKDATLKALALSGGATLSPAFVPSTTTYTAQVNLDVETVKITATAARTRARVAITPADADTRTAGHQIQLNEGANAITVVVTAEDGRTKETYTLTVRRAEPKPADATLEALALTVLNTINTVALSPAFAPSTTQYTAQVGSGIGALTITATAQDAGASVALPKDQSSVSAGHQVLLYGGETKITVVVTAQDGITTKTYTITVSRLESVKTPEKDPKPKSTDATLRAIAFSEGFIKPAFAATTYNYTAAVGNHVAILTVVTISAPGASVAIMPADADPTAVLHQVSLKVGENPIIATVTAEDGRTKKTYTLLVTRAPEADGEAAEDPLPADDEGDEDEPLRFVDGIGSEPVLRLTGALKGQVRGANEQQPRGTRAQQPTLGLDPAAHLDAGQEVELTLTAYQGDERARTFRRTALVEVTGGRGVTLSGPGVSDLGHGRARLDAEAWLDGQRRVVLKDTVGTDTLTVALVADGGLLATLEPKIVYNPDLRARFVVDRLPDTLVVGIDYWGQVAVVDQFGNLRSRDVGAGLLEANAEGIALLETIRWKNGRARFWVRSSSFIGEGLVVSIRDVLDATITGHSAALAVRALDAPDRIVGAVALDDQGSLVELRWDHSADHALVDSYRIFREQAQEGAEPTVVEWAQVAAVAGALEGSTQILVSDTGTTRWGVAAERSVSDEDISVVVVVQGERVAGLTVELFRPPDTVVWRGLANEEGHVNLTLVANAEPGYYHAQASTADGTVVGQWSSLPINANRYHFWELTLGGRAQTEQERPQDAAARTAGLKDVRSSITWTDAPISAAKISAPQAQALHNYPNPFNPTTTIRYALEDAAPVRLEIYNLLGQLTRTLVAEHQDAGRYAVPWDATDERGRLVSAGIYFMHLQVGSQRSQIEKMLLIK